MQSMKQQSALLQIIGVIPHILPNRLQRVTIDNGYVVNNLVTLQLDVITNTLNCQFVFIQSHVQSK
jgi:hypothetical protein